MENNKAMGGLLLVIPELKFSDKGLSDGRAFHFVPVCSQ